MSLRIYCPDCHAPRTVPAAGARVRCRTCDRIFRAGTRIERGSGRGQRTPDDSSGAQKLLIVLGGIAILVFGLTLGGGLAAWYLMNKPPHDPDDEEMIEPNEEFDGPPPPVVADPGPVMPLPNEHGP